MLAFYTRSSGEYEPIQNLKENKKPSLNVFFNRNCKKKETARPRPCDRFPMAIYSLDYNKFKTEPRGYQ